MLIYYPNITSPYNKANDKVIKYTVNNCWIDYEAKIQSRGLNEFNKHRKDQFLKIT